jgi:hypothetical protein
MGILVDLCLKDNPKGVLKICLEFFRMCVAQIEDDRFLTHDKIFRPLLKLLKCSIGEESIDEDNENEEGGSGGGWRKTRIDLEEELCGLMCAVCGRIKNAPEVIGMFLSERRVDSSLGPIHP